MQRRIDAHVTTELPAGICGPSAASQAKIRIAIADDFVLVREALRYLIEPLPDMEVVADVGDGAAAIALLNAQPVDVLLLDVSMPRMDGWTALPEIRAIAPDLGVILLSGHPASECEGRALRLGADAYVQKSAAVDILLNAIRTVARTRASSPPREIAAPVVATCDAL